MSDKELIAEAGKHVPYAAIMDDAKRCMHCADEWPCVTRRLADALEARQPSEDASGAISAVLNRLDELNNGGISYEVYSELHDLVSAIPDAVPDAVTEAKQPEGWSTEDRQESKQEAERRWVDEHSGYKSDYNRGCINGFILGAEWQKARETFISFRSIADEARAGRDAALAAIERVREEHQPCYTCSQPHCFRCKEAMWPCATFQALDGAPEPEVKP